jgi:hypothetical protein
MDTLASPGLHVEERARTIAASLGVSDFVFSVPLVERSPGATREPGDGLLVVGARGAILQVKSREPAAATRDDASSARRWVTKHGTKAHRQGEGTRRSLERACKAGAPLTATPLRALDLPEADRTKYALTLSADASEWPTIVILDHPRSDGIQLPNLPRTFWITLSDWLELNQAMRSVAGILTYVERALEHALQLSVPLGDELDRWSAFLEADKRHAARGSRRSSPWFSDAAITDPTGADLYRELLEYVWPQDGLVTWSDPDEYRRIVEFLDSTPPGLQVSAGRWILKKRRELRDHGDHASGSMLLGDRLLVYLCATEHAEGDPMRFAAELLALTTTRHEEFADSTGRVIETLGIGVRLLSAGGQDYNYQLVLEAPAVPAEVRRGVEWTYGAMDVRLGTTRALAPGRNERCPCGSGRKFKMCHGRFD